MSRTTRSGRVFSAYMIDAEVLANFPDAEIIRAEIDISDFLKHATTAADLRVDPPAHAYPAMHMAQRRDRGYWCVVYHHLVPFHERPLIFAHSFPSFPSPRACIDHPPKQDEQAALAPFTIWPMYTMRGMSPHRTTPSLRLLPAHDIALLLSSRSFPYRSSP
jgi:hypothetical protein